MKISKRVIKLGTSLGIILDKLVIQTLKIKKGDVVNVEIEKE